MIGIFDSGAGGLSVYREIEKLLPDEKYAYFADNAHCPYGGKGREYVISRSISCTEYLLSRGADIVVVACNTATAAAISELRSRFDIPFVGMEPAVKPAALSTRTGVIGVLATQGTLKASKYLDTRDKYTEGVTVIERVGEGFVELVESGQLDGKAAEETVRRSVQPLLDAGADRIVLGCTHYPFLRPLIERISGTGVEVIDPAPAAARHLLEIMEREGIIRRDGNRKGDGAGNADIEMAASGDPSALKRIFRSLP